LFGDVRDRAADEPEGHPLGRLEAHGLERRRDERADRREVLGENHLLAALEHAQLALERLRRPVEVGRSDHLEDELARRGDLPGQRTKWPHRPADAEIDGQRAAHEQAVEAEAESPERGESESSPRGHEFIRRRASVARARSAR
jgi:hypothetical protein